MRGTGRRGPSVWFLAFLAGCIIASWSLQTPAYAGGIVPDPAPYLLSGSITPSNGLTGVYLVTDAGAIGLGNIPAGYQMTFSVRTSAITWNPWYTIVGLNGDGVTVGVSPSVVESPAGKSWDVVFETSYYTAYTEGAVEGWIIGNDTDSLKSFVANYVGSFPYYWGNSLGSWVYTLYDFSDATAAGSVNFTLTQLTGQTSTGFELIEAETSPVPIPAGLWLLGSGLVGLMEMRRRLNR